MANSKMARAKAMEPNRFELAKNMSVVPGGPMNNNPMNVTSVGNQPGSMSGMNQFPYGDSGLTNDNRMGANVLNPMNVAPSQMSPIPMNPQPSPGMADQLESARLGMNAAQKGVTANAMGMAGSGVNTPGAFPMNAPYTTGGSFLTPLTSMNPMTPGATPQKKGQKKGNKGTA
jgi:hypothetical protein|tara:strand:+ start:973 stop:1491 length:519 start_codon:yes stop_codon:yes gene_type:complete